MLAVPFVLTVVRSGEASAMALAPKCSDAFLSCRIEKRGNEEYGDSAG
jgi:hypothetical protein